MAISKENRDFIDSLIDYYINEAESYTQIAENFVPEIGSIPDTAFGIITGCVYSGFLQAYQNQQDTPGLDDIKEFNQIMKERAPLIKKAILERSERHSKDSTSKNTTDDLDNLQIQKGKDVK